MLQWNLFDMLALFWCSQRNTVCFVGKVLVFSTKTHSAGYMNQIADVCIIYQSPNSIEIAGFNWS